MITVPMHMILGLYGSCRQVQKEMDYECTAKMNRMVAKALPPTTLNLSAQFPSSSSTLRQVRIDMDGAAFTSIEPPAISDAMAFVRFARLALEMLNVRVVIRHDWTSRPQNNLMKLIYNCCMGLSEPSEHGLMPVLVPSLVFKDPTIMVSSVTIIKSNRLRDLECKDGYMVSEWETVAGVNMLRTAILVREKDAKHLMNELVNDLRR
jgi:hypothetical protein